MSLSAILLEPEVVAKMNEDTIEELDWQHQLLSSRLADYIPWCDVLPTVNSSKHNDGAIIIFALPMYHVKVSIGLELHVIDLSTGLVDMVHAQT